jgi:hypothetical protein
MSAHLRDDELLDPPAWAKTHLEKCDGCSARRASQLSVRSALRALPREADVPPTALVLLDAQRRRQRSLRRVHVASLVASALVAVAGILLFARHRGGPLPADLADELALDHLHYEHHVEQAAVRGDPATISAYFGMKLGFAPHYGSLEAVTFEGAKPCRIAGKWTALAWIERAGHWLSLFTMPEHVAYRRGCAPAQGVRVCAVPDPSGGARVLVGDLPAEELLRLADESLQ